MYHESDTLFRNNRIILVVNNLSEKTRSLLYLKHATENSFRRITWNQLTSQK